jgi:endonuclease YncB( thermonuclease family)
MQILIRAAVMAAAITATITSAAAAQSAGRSEPVLVQSVIDGDTIVVSAYGHVRLLGIDAPEIGRVFDTSAPFARDARDRLTSLVLHRWVRLETDGPTLDVYGRRLAYVMTEDGQCINTRLVQDGLARVSARLPLSRLPELKRAEEEAQSWRRGMWGTAPQIPSTSYTRPAGAGRSRAPRARAPRSSKKKPAAQKTRTKKRHRDSRRVRRASQDPRAQQTVLPRQSLADLDLRVLHRARPADVRSVRARL